MMASKLQRIDDFQRVVSAFSGRVLPEFGVACRFLAFGYSMNAPSKSKFVLMSWAYRRCSCFLGWCLYTRQRLTTRDGILRPRFSHAKVALVTAQIADGLDNTHPRIRFEDLGLYGVIRGNPYSNHGWGTPYEFIARPDPERVVSSACWRGFQSWFRLEADGTIILERFEYPFTSRPPRLVNEPLTGDFFLVFKRCFFGCRIYALFRDGKIVADSSQWLFEPSGGWRFEQGTHRDSPAMVVEPDAASGRVQCPTCRITFSVFDENTWNGSSHCCGQSLKLVLAGKVLDNDVASHRVLFDGIAIVLAYTSLTEAVCPRCSKPFSLHDVSDQDTVRHECGQRMTLSLIEPPPPMPFDLAKVEALSRPLLARLHSTKDGKLTSGTCPNCGTENNLRVCDGRVVLCFKCYMGVSGRPWLHET